MSEHRTCAYAACVTLLRVVRVALVVTCVWHRVS